MSSPSDGALHGLAGPSADVHPDLASLTGVRSGKRSYYRAFRLSSEQLETALHSLDRISLALVRTVEGPRALLTAVVRAAHEHLQARWVVLAVADGALPDARPRFLGTGPRAVLIDREDDLPPPARDLLRRLRTSPPATAEILADHRVLVPMTIDGIPVGGIAGAPGLEERPQAIDLAVLRILVNQAAVALHSAFLYQSSVALRNRTEQLSQQAIRNARDLAARNQELYRAQQLLLDARERETLDAERHRIARELHDSVSQYVLTAGMTLEICRNDLAALGGGALAISERLAEVSELTRQSVDRLRTAIYALNHSDDASASLPRLLEQAVAFHAREELRIDLRLEGSPVPMLGAAERSLSRVAGEALFNVAAHSRGSRAVVRLSYRPGTVRLTVDDDGDGDPATLRTLLRVEAAGDVDGRHRGLVNMASRAEELGGSFTLRRSRLGGVRIDVRAPAPAGPAAGESGR